MDITVSIADHTSLSSSEVIRRKLYSSVQIGNTCHAGSGVLIDGAKFRSGTVENPLVLTVRNSQTESVMYVRNVPISAVLERGGLEQWVAVYPPGDPQNYHFDAAAPAAGPRLRLSVAVREDEAGGAAGAAAGAAAAPPGPSPFRPPRRAAGGAPAGAEEGETGDASNWPRHSLDRSGAEPFVDCPQPALLAQQLDVPGQGERGPPWVLRASTGEAGIGGGLDGSFRLKAQRLKEHVAEVASAAKRAQDVTRNLQESLRIRDDLRRQLQGLGEEIATQQAAAHCLERELGKLRAEDAQLKEQISQRNAAFQGLRDNRDGIDRELSRALSEGQRRRGEMDTSSLEFAQQRQAMTNEIEHSKLHVSGLTVSLKNKEEVVAESHRKAREALQAAISQARADLAGARATLEEQHRACGRLDARRGEAMERFMGLQGASASAGAAARDRPSHRAADAGADLESRRGKIQAQLSRARKLGEELDEKRGQVERMGARAADLHAEARERDLAASRCREARAELERQLEERRASALPPREQLLASGGQLARAEQEAQRALEALAVLGPGAPGAPGGAPEAPGGAPAAPAPELAHRPPSSGHGSVEDRVIQAVKKYAGVRINEIQNETTDSTGDREKTLEALSREVTLETKWEDLGFDDLDKVEVLLEVEDEFNHVIPDDDADRIASVKESVEYLQKHLDA